MRRCAGIDASYCPVGEPYELRGLVDAPVIGGGGASRDARKEVPMRVSMGRLQGLRLGMSHQNDAAQKAAPASEDVGGRRERRLAREPGIKG